MLSFDRRLKAGLVAIVLSTSLAGCFRPLYGSTTATGGSVPQELSSIKVEPVPDRLGHYLVQDLAFEFNGGTASANPRYKLVMIVTRGLSTPVINSSTGRPDSATLQVTAEYKLIRIDTEAVVTEGRAMAAASYDRLSQRFSAARANRDAEIRVSRVLADQIKTRVATALVTGR